MTKEIKTFLRRDEEVSSEPYHYKTCGLDDVYLLNGFTVRETAYGRGVAIDDVEGLHQAIADHLMMLEDPLNGPEFRFLRKHMGMTQQALAQRLRVDVQTVARYEKEETANGIPGPTELLIRALYLVHTTDGDDDAMELLERVRNLLNDEHPVQPSRPTPTDGWSAGAPMAH